MVNLYEKPFNLTGEQVEKIENIISSLSLKEKVGQLFCLHGDFKDKQEIEQVLSNYHPGAMMYRPGDSKQIQNIHRFIQEKSRVPLLLAANLESGGDGIGNDGTFFGRAIQVAAGQDKKHAYRLGKVAAVEGAAVGCNWSFAPVVDINFNFSNPITNVRTFGSDVNKVIESASEYIKACQEEKVAVSIKHFPGDGVDDRDQHLLTSVNSLSTQEWDETYGKVYKTLIDEGAKTVMAGHISQPAYSKKLNPELSNEEILPASLSKELLEDLLRGQLGFNGMVVTDATNMAGFGACGQRKELLVQSINAGCDMLLFTKNLEEDYQSVRTAVETGLISDERLTEALYRILGTKASLDLFESVDLVPDESALAKLKCETHVNWANELADDSITLVKDSQKLLPINLESHRRILVIVLGDLVSASGKPPVSRDFIKGLEEVGFEVELYDKSTNDSLNQETPVAQLRERYDLVVYFANIKTASNQTTVRINWLAPMGLDVPWFVHELPTLFISMANPYHLQDVPMVKTYINAYTANEFNTQMLVKKLTGLSEFKGKSPIDPFCGYEDAR